MEQPQSLDYFQRRAEEERAAAEKAADERAAHSHRELAEEYEKRANGQGELLADGDQEQEPGTLAMNFRILP
jgi:hypothetical protein